MNKKYSLSTSRLVLLLAGAVLGVLPLGAQEVWREGRNISGLLQYEGMQVEARLGGKYTSGGFHLPSEADQLWQGTAEAQAESHYKDLVFVGAFSFDVQHGKGMMGSMFTLPGYYPIDVLEFTPGPKTRQTYGVGGGMAVNTHTRWIPGFTLQFQGINYAKRKDLRHTTYRQEISFAPSVLYNGDLWKAGATLILDKNSEFIQAEQVGAATAETYYAFLDKGKRYGTLEAWNGSGIHLADPGVDRLAVNQTSFGAALQTSCGESFYADLEYRYSHGQVGEKGYTWFRFPGQSLEGKVLWNIPGSKGLHTIRAYAQYRGSDTYESVIDRITSGGVTTPVIYGSNRIYRRRALSSGQSYTFESSKGWSIKGAAGIEWEKDRGTHMYPFLEYDNSAILTIQTETKIPLGHFSLEAGLLFRHKVADEHLVVDQVEDHDGVHSFPMRLQDWWDMEEEFRNVTLLGASLSIRYNFIILEQKLFVEAGCQYSHAFGIQLLSGSDRQETHLSIGYNF